MGSCWFDNSPTNKSNYCLIELARLGSMLCELSVYSCCCKQLQNWSLTTSNALTDISEMISCIILGDSGCTVWPTIFYKCRSFRDSNVKFFPVSCQANHQPEQFLQIFRFSQALLNMDPINEKRGKVFMVLLQ